MNWLIDLFINNLKDSFNERLTLTLSNWSTDKLIDVLNIQLITWLSDKLSTN